MLTQTQFTGQIIWGGFISTRKSWKENNGGTGEIHDSYVFLLIKNNINKLWFPYIAFASFSL